MKEKIRFFEEIAANAHIALNVALYDGWLLRSSYGHTNRANSISVIYPCKININQKIPYCEEWYKKQELPCLFKITQEKCNKKLNKALKARGYQADAETDVLILDLDSINDFSTLEADYEITFSEKPTEEWISAFFDFKETNQKDQETFRLMLSKVSVKTIYASLKQNGKIVACASAAIEHGFMLLQNVVVDKNARKKGFGKLICQAIILESKKEGAKFSYLQVLKTNEIAINLYKKLGFKKLYSYWYMIQKRL